MLKVILFAGFLGLGSAAFAETCAECMAECPHDSRDFKPCDRGCPEVCGETAFKKCEACMSECPHLSRDFRACDGGCEGVCEAKHLSRLLIQTRGDLKDCTGGAREPNAVKPKKPKTK